jgi:hypothetical protein
MYKPKQMNTVTNKNRCSLRIKYSHPDAAADALALSVSGRPDPLGRPQVVLSGKGVHVEQCPVVARPFREDWDPFSLLLLVVLVMLLLMM